MSFWASLFGRGRQLEAATPLMPISLNSPDAALQFSCSITPEKLADGQAVVGVIDDVIDSPSGPIALVRYASPDGAKAGMAIFPCQHDLMGATARMSDFCMLVAGPDAPPSAHRPMLVAAILRTEFDPAARRWSVSAPLNSEHN